MHVAIIPDGNRRWAKSNGLNIIKGHEKSTEPERVIELLDSASNLGIECISIWGFSTENWKRKKTEREFLFGLIRKLVGELRSYALEKEISFRHVGRKDRLPSDLIKILEDFELETSKNEGLIVNLLLDYGGRDEIIRAIGNVKGEIGEKEFLEYLDTSGLPEPDLIIRTGGEKRLSGLMSYQSAYAELYFIDKYFPDFEGDDLRDAVEDFGMRKRRFGS
jgi:undecaprenyl diphosphate synthase